MAYLVLEPEGRAEVHRLGVRTTIGRERDTTLRLSDPSVSRYHCAIERTTSGLFRLSDQDSASGTLVNGVRIATMLLRTGDRIVVGSSELLFCHALPDPDSVEFRPLDETTLPPQSRSAEVEDLLGQMSRALVQLERIAGAEGIRRAEQLVGRKARQTTTSRYQQLVAQRNQLLELIEINRAITTELRLDQLLEMILDDLLHLAGAKQTFIVTYDEAGSFEVASHRNAAGVLLQHPEQELSRSILNRVFTTQRAVYSHDALHDSDLAVNPSVSRLGLCSVLCVPLRVDNELYGALYVENRGKEHAFGPSEAEMIEAFADQASIALRNAHQREEILRSHRALDALFRTSREVASALDVADVLPLIVSSAHELTGSSLVALLLLDAEGNLSHAHGRDLHGQPTTPGHLDPHLHVIRGLIADRRRQREGPFVVVPLIARAKEHLGVLVVAKEAGLAPRWAGGVELIEQLAGVAALALSNARLYQQATTDELTGLFKRAIIDDRLSAELRRAERHETDLAVAMIDLDHFKALNDAQGHAAGDAALRLIGSVLRTTLREFDHAARYGGEEFVVVMPRTSGAAGLAVAERLRLAIMLQTELPFTLSASIGVAEFEPGLDAAALLDRADRMLYQAKRDGRNLTRLWPGGSPA